MENTFALGKGIFAKQAHVSIPAGTYEEELGREGFFGRVSHLYHAHPPTGWTRIEGPLRPHALRTMELATGDLAGARGRPTVFLGNDDVMLAIARPTTNAPYTFRNADADEVHFIHKGGGVFETDFGPLDYEVGDYVVLPRGTSYR